ncbi:magnesium and cobalt transport protein CorA [Rhodococcus rhodochrous]|uniref:magnesium and cobalt transport protein CorA n=1 Tax=Rhodococcus rhodochrous TaxID=1829 RepID=UPI001E4D420E|nr:magnesium and cobalt transport protein CorA [Rhodococcus rhodochrous]MCD2099076.1 magnesium and cobalt transport protein CorA [Rhodococcus rhodochrous]MCD2123560.1 magnesium and cobalt transport protein CorA [Rhodococcus rhodochrous]MCQ4136215.1 magnesium and cobalt transport protein CorA [Rhodococcus rhodochrous]MDJ0020240.1 magnesium and cobalt transport protein CorA [Rhodococcus rhodochrous]
MPHQPSRATRRGPTPPVPTVPTAQTVVDCAVYVDGHRLPGRYTHTEAVAEVRRRGTGFVWLGLHHPDEEQMSNVSRTFGLHELMVEDAVHAHQRPKLERYDDVLFLVLRTVSYIEHESVTTTKDIVETGEIMLFTGPDFIVSVRHGDHSELSHVRKRLEHDPDHLSRGPAAVLHAIADHVVDSYLAVTTAVQPDVDDIEELVFTPDTRIAVDQIYMLKREIVQLRRAVVPLAEPLQQLIRAPGNPIPKDVRRYFRDVADHHTTVSDRIAAFDETLGTLLDAAIAKVTVQQNTDMRKISAWVAIAAVPTMIAGIYGMNFDRMPELQWEYGYYVVLAAIVAITVGLFVTFRRNNWL